METIDFIDPFSVPVVLHDKTLVTNLTNDDEPLGLFTAIDFTFSAFNSEYVANLSEKIDDDLVLPRLESLELSEVEDVPASDGSVFSLEPELPKEPTSPKHELDVWDTLLDGKLSNEGRHTYSWEGFTNPRHVEPASGYLAEAGIGAFDTTLGLRADTLASPTGAGIPVQQDPLFAALLALSLGRSSLFFNYNEDAQKFEHIINNMRMPGHSLEASNALIDMVLQCGNRIRCLEAFVSRTYRSSTALQAMVAMATSVETILSTVEDYIAQQALRLRSFIQLLALIRHSDGLLQDLSTLVDNMKQGISDVDLASRAYEHVQRLVQCAAGSTTIFKQVFGRVSLACLRTVSDLIGLTSDSYGATEEQHELPDLPSFVDLSTANDMRRLSDSLHLLRLHQHEHLLCHVSPSRQHMPQLEVKFEWPDFHHLAIKATEYEQNLSSAVLAIKAVSSHSQVEDPITKPVRSTETSYDWEEFARQIELSDSPLPIAPRLAPLEPLQTATFAYLEADNQGYIGILDPDFSLCPSLSFSPILGAQSRLVNAAVLRLIFRSSHLRAHLDLQHQFHLLGNGSFVARLTSALFDPTRATAERHKGVMRTYESMGLRLGSRNTWPPASSELQLALMGILAECYHKSRLPKQFHQPEVSVMTRQQRSEIPGGLSFSVRQLPPDQADRCMNADSLYALDFLRLQYTAASPIDAIITNSSLEKYDAIFKVLLRLQHMLFVVSHLPWNGLSRGASDFRFQAHHFVTKCASYFFDTGITLTWRQFQAFLNGAEQQLRHEDEAGELNRELRLSLEHIREAHERCLDRILLSLLLRKRHWQVMTLLEEIFGIILSFAKDPYTESAAELRREFRSKVLVFVNVCRGLVAKQSYEDESGGIERLLVLLEMNRYYDMA